MASLDHDHRMGDFDKRLWFIDQSEIYPKMFIYTTKAKQLLPRTWYSLMRFGAIFSLSRLDLSVENRTTGDHI